MISIYRLRVWFLVVYEGLITNSVQDLGVGWWSRCLFLLDHL